jgi:hypothetical protein
MKKLISRALTLVVIAGTISNTMFCLAPKAKIINQAVLYEKKVNAANMAVAEKRDKGASVDEQNKAEKAAKKVANEARSWLDSIKELSTSTKLLLGTIATTGVLIGIDYGIAKYTNDRMRSAKALEYAQTAAKPYIDKVRAQASQAGEYIRTSRVNPWNWRKPVVTVDGSTGNTLGEGVNNTGTDNLSTIVPTIVPAEGL